MLALKKKREKEKKEAEEAAKNEASAAASPVDAPGGQVSLFGIGGKKKTKKEIEKAKKSPGEIRIQKGNFHIATNLQDALNQSHVSQMFVLPPICRYWRIRWWQSSND
jgi:hypothetical protein